LATPLLVIAVHDEVVVECDADKADAVRDWLRRAMEDALMPRIAPVPVDVELQVENTWAGGHGRPLWTV